MKLLLLSSSVLYFLFIRIKIYKGFSFCSCSINKLAIYKTDGLIKNNHWMMGVFVFICCNTEEVIFLSKWLT